MHEQCYLCAIRCPRLYGRHRLSDTGGFEPLQRTYKTDTATSAKSSQELSEIYDNWAEDYERRILSYGYSTPAVTAGFFGRYVKPEDGAVLDAGAGTGIMGPILAPLGYRDLIGIDISPRMLELAAKKVGIATSARWSWAENWTSPPTPSPRLSLQACSPQVTPRQSPLRT